MLIVLLQFSANKAGAGAWMDGHKQWLQRGFDDGVFLLAGSLHANQGGAVLAHHTTLPALQERVNNDPFVVHDVVSAQVFEITPSRLDERLQSLLASER